ncbi:DUF1254 domain-containing protein [Flavobacterium sp. 245]|uniref:DUF1254 domain-containing protein n=1 Tax=Flavobacterium sp. 245 TaxID=2512115 RepID=UPI00105D1C56|nr:DUF1254 domain-containing protein [Flavobacterium sp. 245]TDP04045.1 hypothetical protein EV145_101444 [Flavobacterium sp. 245]
MKKNLLSLMIVFLCFACGKQKQNDDTTAPATAENDTEIIQIAKDAYIYGYPLVLMDASKKVMTNAFTANSKNPAVNQVGSLNEFPDDKFRDVVKPNADTYYSMAWLDLGKEPLVLKAPNTNGRYYLLPILDAWTNIFASPGKRTTGTAEKTFLITGPNWKGTVPAGMEQLKSPTDMAWMIGRTQVNSKEDGATAVKKIQQNITLTPLSAYGKAYTGPKAINDPSVSKTPPVQFVKEMSVDAFFSKLNELMVANPAAPDDAEIVAKMKKLGLEPGKPFDISKFSATVQDSLKAIPAWGNKFIAEMALKSKKPVNGWVINHGLGEYKTNYEVRAMVAMVGLGANLDADAIYPMSLIDADGEKFDGSKHNYILHFDAGKLPPVNAFWSLTMYGTDDFMVANPINRFAIGDRNNLKKNADGSVDIYIQKNNPGKDKEKNWLPAPNAQFQLTMRLYWPKEEVIKGNWTPPAVVKVK